MKLKLMEKVVSDFPYPFLLLKEVKEDEFKQPDFIFLDTNQAFEEMTGLKKKDILNQKASAVFVSDWTSSFDWPGFFMNIVQSGAAGEAIRFVKTIGKNIKVTAYPVEQNTLAIILQNVLPEASMDKIFEEQKTELTLLGKNFETIFNTTHDAMYIVEHKDGEFRYLRNNAVYQKLSGLSSSHIFGKTPVEVMGEEQGSYIQENYRRCVERGASITYEQTLPFEVGVTTWLITLTPIFENGFIRYLIGSGKDITDFISLKQEKNDLLNRLESMFQEHTACMLLIDPQSGRILDANPAACAFYGYSPEEFMRLSITDINALPPEETEQMRKLALEERQNHFIFPHRLKNGSQRLVDVYSCPVKYGSENQLFSIIFDVTDRESYRENLYNEKELLRMTLLSIGDGVITTDISGRVTNMNEAAQDISGWKADEAKNLPFTDILKLKNEETGKEVENPIRKVLSTGNIIGLANHTYLVNKHGKSVPIADSAAPIRDESGDIFGVVMVFRDVSQEKEQEDKILFLSYHDELTGLYNRRYLENEMKKFNTGDKLPVAIIMADVNGLKITNDVFGHQSGDRLLQNVAKILSGNCLGEQILARWGGDEFVMLLPGTSEEQVEQLLKKIRAESEGYSDGDLKMSISLGFAVLHSQEDDIQHKLQEAEEAMYHQKLLEGKSYRNTIISTLLATLNEKSMETEEHAQRMKRLCEAMGEALKLSETEINDLTLLAILHDIGKVGIPQNILKKPGSLTAEEWKEMRKHSEIGYRIAQTTPELSVVAEYILSHHERWDGTGYPSGLRGERIPLLCRILSVVDAYDAMTNDRVYRKAVSKEAAEEELLSNAGTQFDPGIVELFLKILSAAESE